MAPFKGFFALFCVLALAIMACGVSVDLGIPPTPTPAPASQLSLQEGVATGVAQALQAMTQQAPSATPTSTPSATPTATSGSAVSESPRLSVSNATNCRLGPRSDYGLVMTLRPGTVVSVVGQDAADNYWIIEVPGYPGTTCWLWGQYASVTGYTGYLYSPATPVISTYTLDEPRNLRASCIANYSSDSHDDWWDHDPPWGDHPPGGDDPPWGDHPPGGDDPPWGDHPPGGDVPPWGDPPPGPDDLPLASATPTASQTAEGNQPPGGHEPPGSGDSPSGHGSHGDSRTPWAYGTPWASGTPWAYGTPWPNDGRPWGDRPQSSAGAQWASYPADHHIDSWTVVLKWKNIEADQTGVRVYRNGHRIATLGKNASSYTDTVSGDWDDDVTYGVQAFGHYSVSSIVSIDVDSCE